MPLSLCVSDDRPRSGVVWCRRDPAPNESVGASRDWRQVPMPSVTRCVVKREKSLGIFVVRLITESTAGHNRHVDTQHVA
jgi:hypothetical protein